MKKFAVGVIDFFDNNLVIEIIEATNWKDALLHHSYFLKSEDWKVLEEDYSYFGDTLKDAKISAFNADMMIDVKEITDEENRSKNNSR